MQDKISLDKRFFASLERFLRTGFKIGKRPAKYLFFIILALLCYKFSISWGNVSLSNNISAASHEFK